MKPALFVRWRKPRLPSISAAFPREAIDRATAGPDADIYQFVCDGGAGAVGPTVEQYAGTGEHAH